MVKVDAVKPNKKNTKTQLLYNFVRVSIFKRSIVMLSVQRTVNEKRSHRTEQPASQLWSSFRDVHAFYVKQTKVSINKIVKSLH